MYYNVLYNNINITYKPAMDMTYWYNFYNEVPDEINQPSDFCKFVIEYFKHKKDVVHVLDAGCGNGRDTRHLSSKFIVDGVDNSGHQPTALSTRCVFMMEDFTTISKTKYDMIYSRFTFHSITNEQHSIFLEGIQNDCYLCIETRSDKSIREERHFKDGHYRNFTNIDYMKRCMNLHNFEILYIHEDKNMAIYKDENPYCIRVICKKKNDV